MTREGLFSLQYKIASIMKAIASFLAPHTNLWVKILISKL